jgi:hypothetical protein
VLREVVGDETQVQRIADAIAARGFVCVPRVPTKDMIEAAWAEALAEDAAGVWQVMVEAYESNGKSASSNG